MLLIAFFAWLTLCTAQLTTTTANPPVPCDCSIQLPITAAYPNWIFGRSLIGNLLATVVNVVDQLLTDVLGPNAVITVNVGDIISLKITTTPDCPFTVWTTPTGGVYSGFNAPNGVYIGVGPSPLLTIDASVAGKTLYYVNPNAPHMGGLIRVNANTAGLLGTTGLLGDVVQTVNNVVDDVLGVQHTYIINAAYPHWNFVGSLVGDVLGAILGNNPILNVRVGDILTFRVTTTPQHPFVVCLRILSGVCTPYPGFSAPQGYLGVGSYPTLLVRADVAGQTLIYASLSHPADMSGNIIVAPTVSATATASAQASAVAVPSSGCVTYQVHVEFPNFNFVGSLLNTVGSIVGSVLGLNPVITAHIGDILTFQLTTTNQYPFSIYTTLSSTAAVYAGLSVPSYIGVGAAPMLTIGAELAGSTLYYCSPPYIQSHHMFGIIQVEASASVSTALAVLNANLKVNVRAALHTYVLSPVNGAWVCTSSLIGTVLNSILGVNPVIYVNVGDVIVFRVITTSAYPFTISTSSTAIVVYAGFSVQAVAGFVTGDLPTLVIGAELSGQTLYYICPNNLNIVGRIVVAV